MQSIKEHWQKLSAKTQKAVIAIVAGTAAMAIIGVLALNLGGRADYSTLFTGLNQEDAQQVVSLLQEEGVDYHFNEKEGSIQVPSSQENTTRAQLLSQGYPKSGFTYDMYRDNAGLMTTESDKKQYTLYELQDRLGSQIRLFDGVRDAKVTIAEAGTQKYALEDETQTNASASVVVTMKDGQSLTENRAAAIKNLIARAVKGMNFTNVAVFDAATMTEVGSGGAEDAMGGRKDLEALTNLVESNIEGNIRRVLEMLYGQGNVAVSVKGTLNMERLIQESTEYTTPDKIDEEDKLGLLQRETVTNENTGTADQAAGGVAGADANADTPRYTNNQGTQTMLDGYANSSADREWLYNSVKQQRQVDPGVLENATVGVVINTDDMTVREQDLINLVANSSGIDRQEAGQKITIIRALSADTKAAQSAPAGTQPVQTVEAGLPLPIIIALIAGGVLILLLLLLLLLSRRKKKQAVPGFEDFDPAAFGVEQTDEEPAVAVSSLDPALQESNEEMERNEEILNLRMQHSLKLKQNIGEFIEQNPQIAAKLMQSWLRGEGENNGGNRRNDSARK